MYNYIAKEPKWQTELINKLAKKYNLKNRVVRDIVYYPLHFLREAMLSDEDELPVRVKFLGIFRLKARYGKYVKNKERGDYLLDHADVLWDKVGVSRKRFFRDEAHFRNTVSLLVKLGNRKTLDFMIYQSTYVL